MIRQVPRQPIQRSCQLGPERRVQRLRFDPEIAWVAFLSLRPSLSEVEMAKNFKKAKTSSVHVALDIPFWQWPNSAAPSCYFPLASRPYRPISGLTDHRIFAFSREAGSHPKDYSSIRVKKLQSSSVRHSPHMINPLAHNSFI